MDLYFFRHGVAAEKETYPRDADRPLTGDGAKEVKKAARGMQALGLKFDLILSSPFERAKKTAEIAAEELKCKHLLQMTEHLQTDGDPLKLLRQINRLPHAPFSIMLVGHEPYLSHLMTTLLTGEPASFVVLKKAGLAKLKADSLKFGKCAELRWLLTPKQLTLLKS